MSFHKKMIQIQDRMKEQSTRIRDNENSIRGIQADQKKNQQLWTNFENYKKSLEAAHNEISKFQIMVKGHDDEINIKVRQLQSQVQYNSNMFEKYNLMIETKEESFKETQEMYDS